MNFDDALVALILSIQRKHYMLYGEWPSVQQVREAMQRQ